MRWSKAHRDPRDPRVFPGNGDPLVLTVRKALWDWKALAVLAGSLPRSPSDRPGSVVQVVLSAPLVCLRKSGGTAGTWSGGLAVQALGFCCSTYLDKPEVTS